MQYCQLLIPDRNAFECIARIGHLGLVEFETNSSPLLHHVNHEITRCYELQGILSKLQEQLEEIDSNSVFDSSVNESLYENSVEVSSLMEIEYISSELLQINSKNQYFINYCKQIKDELYNLEQSIRVFEGLQKILKKYLNEGRKSKLSVKKSICFPTSISSR
ncbi:hypothetical protein GJ496_002862 [Pomphorhynchus laevis]|nr:hypothetical protein GJ496_002862 [Pomphorhynchus laevis]